MRAMKQCGMRQDITMPNGGDVILNTGPLWELFIMLIMREVKQNHKENTSTLLHCFLKKHHVSADT